MSLQDVVKISSIVDTFPTVSPTITTVPTCFMARMASFHLCVAERAESRISNVGSDQSSDIHSLSFFTGMDIDNSLLIAAIVLLTGSRSVSV